MISTINDIEFLRNFIAEAQQEPVAWRVWIPDEERFDYYTKKPPIVTATPLYAAPLAQPGGKEQWISVKERLPDVDAVVRVGGSRGLNCDACLASPEVHPRWCAWDHEVEDWKAPIHMEVTHWMPLPAAPVEPAAQEGKP